MRFKPWAFGGASLVAVALGQWIPVRATFDGGASQAYPCGALTSALNAGLEAGPVVQAQCQEAGQERLVVLAFTLGAIATLSALFALGRGRPATETRRRLHGSEIAVAAIALLLPLSGFLLVVPVALWYGYRSREVLRELVGRAIDLQVATTFFSVAVFGLTAVIQPDRLVNGPWVSSNYVLAETGGFVLRLVILYLYVRGTGPRWRSISGSLLGRPRNNHRDSQPVHPVTN